MRKLWYSSLILAAGCGGGGDLVGPPPPAPVARVGVSPETATLVPQQTVQPSATAYDGAGKALSGRVMTWTTSAVTVATVSSAGLVTAVAPGSATITATSEGKSATSLITVTDGGFVEPAGGTVTSANGDVKLVVPAGAVPAGAALTVTPTNDPPPPPAGTHAVRGTTYVFGPEGTQFAAPVTVILKYDPSSLPRWVLPGDLVLQRWNGTQWSTLTNIVVDPVAHTVSGQTPGFSTVGVYFLNPAVTLTPGPASVSSIQRSVVFSAEIAGEGRLPDALQYEWSTTGSNGTLGAQLQNTMQYTAVTPVLPAGDLDGVDVVVRGQFEPNGPFEVIGRAGTTVRADLKLVIQLQPASTVVQYSGSAQLTAVVSENGAVRPNLGDLLYEWSATTNAGTLSPTVQGRGNDNITYTAYPASQQLPVFPKGDKITVKVLLLVISFQQNPLTYEWTMTRTETPLGQADAFVQVIPQYRVILVPNGAQLKAGESVGFQVQLEPAWQGDELLSYRWRNTGNYGQLNVTPGTITSQNSVTYTANSNVGSSGGVDLVDVDVYMGLIPVGQIGSAQANVAVEPRTTELDGSWFISDPVGLDAGRQCVTALIQFPLVSGATSYEMHAYGFNDTAAWGTEIRKTLVPPLPAYKPCSLATQWGSSGSDGSNYLFFLSGFAGPASTIGDGIAWMSGRFAGMIVKVTVRY